MRYSTVADAPLPQSTGGGVSKGDMLYTGGGLVAAITLALLLFYILRRSLQARRQAEKSPPGADEATIAALKTIVYAAPVEEEAPTKCDICLEEFTEGEPLKQLPCDHFFHLECARKALLLKKNCPKCRFEV